jgi:hypothetical protein
MNPVLLLVALGIAGVAGVIWLVTVRRPTNNRET